MYGLLIEATVEFIKAQYGLNTWEVVRKKAKIDSQVFSTHQQYSETLIQRIVKHLADITGQSIESIMDMLGVEFVNFVAQYGYDRILRVLGRHMRDFLNGLDNLHEYMRFSYPKLKPPSFFVEQESAQGLILHYRSKRKGFVHYVKGQIRQVGKVFYNININIDILSEKMEMELVHVVFQLNFENSQYQNMASSTATSDLYIQNNSSISLPIRSEIFFELFPFHVVFKRNLEIISIGESLKQAMKNAEGESVTDVFNLMRPLMSFNWQNITGHTNNVFEMTTIEPVRRAESPNGLSKGDPGDDECLKLRGQMMYVQEWDAMIFLATPVLENLDVMFQTGFYINDLSMHDSSRDLVLVGTQQSAELKLALDQEKQKSKALEDSMKKLDIEMKRTDQLLYQMIPKKIADRLRSGEPVMNLCEVFNNCTILFSDVVGFTSTCSQLTPMEVVSMLNEMYTKFDKCLELHNVYKVETIGDAYMVVSGLPERNQNHAIEIIDMGFDMLAAISTLKNPATDETVMIRIGCHSGPTVAGVVGLKMPRYCLFGDAVNTASRMESTSEAMRIHISESTKTLIEHQPYKIIERGKLEVKGKGEMKTYFVLNKIDKNGMPATCPFMEIFAEQKKLRSELSFNKDDLIKNNDDTKSIKSNGYAPVLMEDVRRSKASLRGSQLSLQDLTANTRQNVDHPKNHVLKMKRFSEEKTDSFDVGEKSSVNNINEMKYTQKEKVINYEKTSISNMNKIGKKDSIELINNSIKNNNAVKTNSYNNTYTQMQNETLNAKMDFTNTLNNNIINNDNESKKMNDSNRMNSNVVLNGGSSSFIPIQNQIPKENTSIPIQNRHSLPAEPKRSGVYGSDGYVLNNNQSVNIKQQSNFVEYSNNLSKNDVKPTLPQYVQATPSLEPMMEKPAKKLSIKSLTCALV